MSDTSANYTSSGSAIARGDVARFKDYWALLKPRVMSLVVFTSMAGLVVAPGDISITKAVVAILAIALGAGASGALNMWYDADIDAKMQRTAMRPIPRGKVSRDQALGLGVILSVISVFVLGLVTNWVAAGLLAMTICYYLFIYTMWLKRRTPQNIVIGGAAGAFPPMIGWAAVTGSISIESLALFLIIFVWTPPHFWALALYRSSDYERANVPMLPVVAGPDETRRQILIYSVILMPVSLLPTLLLLAGSLYTFTAVSVGALFMFFAWKVYSERFGRVAEKAARRLFAFSIFYLFMLFATLIGEQSLAALGIGSL